MVGSGCFSSSPQSAEKHFLSGLHLEGFDQRDSYYYSKNYDTAQIRVSVRIDTGIGGLKITWL